jgi:aminopeptidase
MRSGEGDTLRAVETGSLPETARNNVRDTLALALDHGPGRQAVVVFDNRTGLSRLLADSYRACLPDAIHLDFDTVAPQVILDLFAALPPGSLVVLIQSTSFRLEAFRIRIELFKYGLKVIEHPHLFRMQPGEYATYIDALAYDPAYYRGLGHALKQRIDSAPGAVVDSGGETLVYDSPLEPAKLNIGDYTGLANVGGQFPIGEVFTEAKDLERVNGRVRIFVFGDTEFRVNAPERPITLVIERGKVVEALDSTPAFERVMAQIRADEELWIRELGFGMNRAFTRDRRVSDVGTYERMCGVHLSLGSKHGVYAKPMLKRKETKYHVDVFAVTESVVLGDETVFRDGGWHV